MTADLTINFGFTSDAQSLQSSQREVEAYTNAFARMIVDNVAYNVATYSAQQAHRTLAKSVRSVVDRELDRMAMTIGNSISITEKARGPQGKMSVAEGLSDTARKRGWASSSYNWSRRSTRIRWAPRDKNYVKWKASRGFTRDWWKKSGKLSQYLSQRTTYTQSFGPVRVVFDRPKNQNKARERVGANPRITASGLTGPITREYEVGKLRVMAMGNLTPADLPSLRTENPSDAKPTNGAGAARWLKDTEEGGARDKLMRFPFWKGKGKSPERRFVLEPFLSFYLTRAIPNAVWRRIEQMPVTSETTRGLNLR
jgi:hypothetical protein